MEFIVIHMCSLYVTY